MKLTLTTPWSPGMNDPGKTYPEVYITQMTDNRTASNFTFIWEAGAFMEVTAPDSDATSTVWVKGPGMISQVATVAGEDYVAATTAAAPDATESAYQSIIRLLYQKLIDAGLAGTIEET